MLLMEQVEHLDSKLNQVFNAILNILDYNLVKNKLNLNPFIGTNDHNLPPKQLLDQLTQHVVAFDGALDHLEKITSLAIAVIQRDLVERAKEIHDKLDHSIQTNSTQQLLSTSNSHSNQQLTTQHQSLKQQDSQEQQPVYQPIQQQLNQPNYQQQINQYPSDFNQQQNQNPLSTTSLTQHQTIHLISSPIKPILAQTHNEQDQQEPKLTNPASPDQSLTSDSNLIQVDQNHSISINALIPPLQASSPNHQLPSTPPAPIVIDPDSGSDTALNNTPLGHSQTAQINSTNTTIESNPNNEPIEIKSTSDLTDADLFGEGSLFGSSHHDSVGLSPSNQKPNLNLSASTLTEKDDFTTTTTTTLVQTSLTSDIQAQSDFPDPPNQSSLEIKTSPTRGIDPEGTNPESSSTSDLPNPTTNLTDSLALPDPTIIIDPPSNSVSASSMMDSLNVDQHSHQSHQNQAAGNLSSTTFDQLQVANSVAHASSSSAMQMSLATQADLSAFLSTLANSNSSLTSNEHSTITIQESTIGTELANNKLDHSIHPVHPEFDPHHTSPGLIGLGINLNPTIHSSSSSSEIQSSDTQNSFNPPPLPHNTIPQHNQTDTSLDPNHPQLNPDLQSLFDQIHNLTSMAPKEDK